MKAFRLFAKLWLGTLGLGVIALWINACMTEPEVLAWSIAVVLLAITVICVCVLTEDE
jgi:hypothetical protein